MLLNGKQAAEALKLHAAFVHQSDLFFKVLTVREHLLFHARLRLGDSVSVEEREERVTAILHEVGLQDVAQTRIGEVGDGGISGGERRRLSLATEIISNPSLVLLDEPTSGLDSFLAEQVVQTLRAMASTGRTLICTIHQPSSEVYAMFDQVCYLAKGQVAFFGNREDALTYFSSTLDLICPPFCNPADFIIKQLSVKPTHLADSKARIALILHTWAGAIEKKVIEQRMDAIAANETSRLAVDTVRGASTRHSLIFADKHYPTTFLTQSSALLWRSALTILRDPGLTRTRAGQTVVLAVIIGLIYLRLGNGDKDIQNRMGVIFLCIMNQGMGSMMGVLSMFVREVPIFLREHQARLYSSYAYYLARSLAELPLQLLWPFLFVSITYWMIGLNDNGGRFIEFCLALMLTANTAMSLGYVVGIAAPTIEIALAVTMPIILPFLLFGGLFINVDSIPVYFSWLSYLSFFKYGYELLAAIVWDGVTGITCDTPPCASNTGAQVLASV